MPTTEKSVFYTLAKQEIEKSGYQAALTSAAFKKVITKTVILEQGKTKATYTWYDDQNRVVAEYQTTQYQTEKTTLPCLGKVETRNARSEYLKEYNRKTRHYHLRLTGKDQDVIDVLDHKDNVQGYLKALIREDIKKQQQKQ